MRQKERNTNRKSWNIYSVCEGRCSAAITTDYENKAQRWRILSELSLPQKCARDVFYSHNIIWLWWWSSPEHKWLHHPSLCVVMTVITTVHLILNQIISLTLRVSKSLRWAWIMWDVCQGNHLWVSSTDVTFSSLHLQTWSRVNIQTHLIYFIHFLTVKCK